jgi:ribosomal protein S4
MVVTGLIVNQRVNVKRKLIKQTRSMLNAWEKYGLERADLEFRKKYEKKERYWDEENSVYFDSVVLGKINFIGMVRGKGDPVYLKLRERILMLEPKFRKSLKVNLALENVSFRSDWEKLRQEEFQSKRDFRISKNTLDNSNKCNLGEIVFRIGFTKSKSAAGRCIKTGEIFVNGEEVLDPDFEINEGDKISVNRNSYLNLWINQRIRFITNSRKGIRKSYQDKYLMDLVEKAETNFVEKHGRWIENLETWSNAWNKLVAIIGDEVGKVFNKLPKISNEENSDLWGVLSDYYHNTLRKEFNPGCAKEKLFSDLVNGGGDRKKRGSGLATINLWVALAHLNFDQREVKLHKRRFDAANQEEPQLGEIFSWLQDNRNKTKRDALTLEQKKKFRLYFYRAWVGFGIKLS